MKSKYVDVNAIMQVIGCVYKHPDLLEHESYFFHEEDFTERFHQVIFGAIYNLKMKGANTISLEDIQAYLSKRPTSEGVFRSNKGDEYLTKLKEIADRTKFDYYYNRMKKMTLLRHYDKFGLDVSWLYDPDNILDLNKKQIQEDWLDNTTLEEIADRVDQEIENIKSLYVDNSFGQAKHASEGIKDLINRLKETPEVGVPLYGDLINTITRGARLKKFYLRSAATGSGKAIPNYTVIPTPLGWRQVNDIQVGDYLYNHNGDKTRVLAVYPQYELKQIWTLHFEDGRVAECCNEHLWEINVNGTRIVKPLKYFQELSKTYSLEDNIYSIRIANPVKGVEKDFDITPTQLGNYLMGSENLEGQVIEKRINEDYMFSSIAQRQELLNALINNSTNDNKISITANDIQQDVCNLIRSLGGIAVANEEGVEFTFDHSQELRIVNISFVETYTQMTCFTVDNPEHLFLMNDFLVTHNTRSMVADACNIACNEIYDEHFGWIKNGTSEPTLFVTTEQELEEVQTMMLAFLSNVDEEKILNGNYTIEEEQRVFRAAEILERSPLYVEELPDFSLKDIENTIKRNYRDNGVKYIFQDYIHTSLKILEEITKRSGGVKLREDNILFMISIRLKDLCNELGVFIMSATQLNGK